MMGAKRRRGGLGITTDKCRAGHPDLVLMSDESSYPAWIEPHTGENENGTVKQARVLGVGAQYYLYRKVSG